MRGHAEYALRESCGTDTAARLLGVSREEVERLVATDPSFPRPSIQSGRARWYESEILNWKANQDFRNRFSMR
jgi:predicted DNA-binding transcriptional regulator AlpA